MDSATIENLNNKWSPSEPSQSRRLKVILPQCYAALAIVAVNLSYLIFELTLSIQTNSLENIIDGYGSITVLGLIIGGIAAQIIGGRLIIMLTAVISAIGWIILGWFPSQETLQWSMYIVSLALGMVKAPCLVYLSEISQPNMRNSLVALMFLPADIGRTYFDLLRFGSLKVIASVNIVLALFGLVLMFILPESPYWLANKGRYNRVESSLAWFRGRTVAVNVISESQAIIGNAQNSPTASNLFCRKSFYVPAVIVGCVFIASLPIRIFFLMNYGREIMWSKLDYVESKYILLIIGILLYITFVVLVAINGKRILFLISLFFGSIAALGASIAGYLNENDIISRNVYSWIFLLCLVVVYISMIFGVVAVPFILNGELFPSKLRYFGAGVGLFFMHLVQLLSSKFYFKYFWLTHGPELALVVISMFGFISLVWLFPRNDNKCLVEIERSSTSINELRRK